MERSIQQLRLLWLLCLSFLLCQPLPAQELGTIQANATQLACYQPLFVLIQVDASFEDPYDPAEIAIDLRLNLPDGSEQIIPAFWKNSSQPGEWEARFTPRQAGTYRYVVHYDHKGVLETSDTLRMEVSGNKGKGFLTLENEHQFRFDSGESFRGLGMNIGWEQRPAYDSDTSLNYRHLFAATSLRGLNYVRTWMCPWNLPLEWNQVADFSRYEDDTTYRFHQGGIQRMEDMLALAEQYEVYVQLVLDYHGALTTEADFWGGNNYWWDHPYQAENGGPADKPQDFFTNEIARNRYKARLRYLVARWSYHPHLAVWELFNEVDNAMESESIPAQDIVNWHEEMAAYLRSIDPTPRPITSSVSHREVPGLFEVANLSLTQLHLYGQTADFERRITDDLTRYQKPAMVGEFAYDYVPPEANQQELFLADLRKGIWSGMHLPTPVLPLTWWWEHYEALETYKWLEVAAPYLRELNATEGEWELPLIIDPPNPQQLEILGVRKGDTHFLWFNNQSGSQLSGKEIRLQGLAVGDYFLTEYNTQTGCTHIRRLSTEQTGGIRFSIPDLPKAGDIACILSPRLLVTDRCPAEGLRLFPNPVADWLTIEADSAIGSLRLYNLQGQLLWEADISEKRERLQMDFLSSGLYVICWQIGNSFRSFRLLKQ